MRAVRSVLLLAALAVAPASAAQEKPSREAPERVGATTTVVRCGEGCGAAARAASLARPIPPLPARLSPVAGAQERGPTLLVCPATGVRARPPMPPFSTEVTRRGITVRSLGYPEPEPATE